jgi:hypothetical protein
MWGYLYYKTSILLLDIGIKCGLMEINVDIYLAIANTTVLFISYSATAGMVCWRRSANLGEGEGGCLISHPFPSTLHAYHPCIEPSIGGR